MTYQATGRKTAGLGQLLLRCALGGTLIAHGLRHARTQEGTAAWFGSIGFRQPRLQAQLSAAVEIGAGAAVASGAATPLAASAVVGTMAVAYCTVHRPNGFFITAEGWEYVGLISATSVALAGLGPGRFSADHLLGVDEVGSPWQRALLAFGLGIGGAAVQLAAFWRPPRHNAAEPVAESAPEEGVPHDRR
jgi:putative oxidoreductase